ncbi:TetR/AcrR family transcriptional regulator [Tsukamurella tyrosinosolvens]|uniref:DNA-binding transcriptional regulator, AcrR family n=1 Tax=Tsukamurella tyrosinosolvens TaxID=57704 RepID=A0A1H4Q0K2_TSUTY|nr:TetR/AcrR family transcriptional regulator [Tsukamurella tyrosinosolvens]MCA4996871.1 TetR/AcrR family transcriptional regulator [Tsukamurella tyrosinosolvens]MEC4615639.1 TetR/AcrR family transcriptional regulator [Tsukamurella tyrosinosolvens]QRY86531.1 TetR/AcrR family transcriptional regulator [Tsukamurella tyrosinosolvens]RDB48704.1 TetR/AcrR family transcriptional regulator [Tsukamurella tyrosinosolvens]WEL94351.1 TetR/AcrR family transcriptional regulator [Tsukamurella tyrosinosolven
MTRKSVAAAVGRKRTRLSPQARRQQFIDLGLLSLKHQALEQVSIEDIASQAGVSAGLLFHYFDSKLDFQVALVEEQARIVGEVATPDRDPEDITDVMPILSATLGTYVDHIMQNRQSLLPMLAGVSWSEPRIRTAVKSVREQIVDHFVSQAENIGIERSPRFVLAVHGWIAVVEETLVQWLDENAGFAAMTRDEVVEHLATMFVGMAGAVGLDLTSGAA